MKKRPLLLTILFVMLLASCMTFSACTTDYSKYNLNAYIDDVFVEDSYIEMDYGQSRDVTFKIDGYDGKVESKFYENPSYDHNIISLEAISTNTGGQITYRITALSGGTTDVTIFALDGYKSCTISIKVNQKASTIANSEVVGYLTCEKDFYPSETYFSTDSVSYDLVFSVGVEDNNPLYAECEEDKINIDGTAELFYKYSFDRVSYDVFDVNSVLAEDESLLVDLDGNEIESTEVLKFYKQNRLIMLVVLDENVFISGTISSAQYFIYLSDGETFFKYDKKIEYDLEDRTFAFYGVTENQEGQLLYSKNVFSLVTTLELKVDFYYLIEEKYDKCQEPILYLNSDYNIIYAHVYSQDGLSSLIKYGYELSLDENKMNVREIQDSTFTNGVLYEISSNLQEVTLINMTFYAYYDQIGRNTDINVSPEQTFEIQFSMLAKSVNLIENNKILANGDAITLYTNAIGIYKEKQVYFSVLKGQIFSDISFSNVNSNVTFSYKGIRIDSATKIKFDDFDINVPIIVSANSENVSSAYLSIIINYKFDDREVASATTLQLNYNMIAGVNQLILSGGYGESETNPYYVSSSLSEITLEFLYNGEAGSFIISSLNGQSSKILGLKSLTFENSDITGKAVLTLSIKDVGSATLIMTADNGESITFYLTVISTLDSIIMSVDGSNSSIGYIHQVTENLEALVYGEEDEQKQVKMTYYDEIALVYTGQGTTQLSARINFVANYTSYVVENTKGELATVSVLQYLSSMLFSASSSCSEEFIITFKGYVSTNGKRTESSVSFNIIVSYYVRANSVALTNNGVNLNSINLYGVDVTNIASSSLRSEEFSIEVKDENASGAFRYVFDIEEFAKDYVFCLEKDIDEQYQLSLYKLSSNGNYIKINDLSNLDLKTYFDKLEFTSSDDINECVFIQSNLSNEDFASSLSFEIEYDNIVYKCDLSEFKISYVINLKDLYDTNVLRVFEKGEYKNSGNPFSEESDTVIEVTNSATSSVAFSNVYECNPFTIDLKNKIITSNSSATTTVTKSYSCVLLQNNWSRGFNFTVYSNPYIDVKQISVGGGIDCITFSQFHTQDSVFVYLNPTDATIDDVAVYYSSTKQCVSYEVVKLSVGIFRVDLAFDVSKGMGGVLYIAPRAWLKNDSFASLDASLNFIKIKIQYSAGTEENPYNITTTSDFVDMVTNAPSAHFSLSADINLASSDISLLQKTTFKGYLDGNGHTISGIVISRLYTDDNVTYYGGLFKAITGKLVSINFEGQFDMSVNLAISNANMIVKLGLLASEISGELTNVGINLTGGSVIINNDTEGVEAQSFYIYIGGVTGYLTGSIYQNFEEEDYVTVISKIESLDVTTNNDFYTYVGGIAGYIDAGELTVNGINSNNTEFVDGYINLYGINNEESNGSINNEGVDHAVGMIAGLVYANPITNDSAFLLLSGELNGKIAGGLFGYYNNYKGDSNNGMSISNITSRVFVRGYQVGLLIGSVVTDILGSTDSANYYLKLNSIIIELTDNAERTGVYRSMVVSYNMGITNQGINNSILTNPINSLASYNITYIGLSVIVKSYVQITPQTYDNKNVDNVASYFYGLYAVYDISDGKITYFTGDNQLTVENLLNLITIDNDASVLKNSEEDEVVLLQYFKGEAYADFDGTLSSVSMSTLLEKANTIKQNDERYPFKITSSDIIMKSLNESVLQFNGFNIILKGVGLAQVQITSKLNKNVSEVIYVYVTYYFDLNDTSSHVYPIQAGGTALDENSIISISGKKQTDIFVSSSFAEVSLNDFTITEDGIINIENTNIYLTSFSDFDVQVTLDDNIAEYISCNVNGTTISFLYKKASSTVIEGSVKFEVRILKVVNRQEYVLSLGSTTATIRFYPSALGVYLSDTAEKEISINSDFEIKIKIDSMNDEEVLYYQIATLYNEIIVQDGYSNVSQASLSEDGLYSDVYDILANYPDLFDVNITDENNNEFNFKISVNKQGVAYSMLKTQNLLSLIYNLKFRISFFGSEGLDGVSSYIDFVISESYVISMTYMNFNNIDNSVSSSQVSSIIIPNVYGLFEIMLMPNDSKFDSVTITNDLINSEVGGNNAIFELVRFDNEKYVVMQDAFSSVEGGICISYQNAIDTYGENFNGNLYIRYLIPSANVINGKEIKFNIDVVTFAGNLSQSVSYNLQLQDYVRMTILERDESLTGEYILARGLEYTLNLSYFGYDESQITIRSSDEDIVKIDRENGLLIVTENVILYTSGQAGKNVKITASASKIVDGVSKVVSFEMNLTIMEYVITGDLADIFSGMDNGVISLSLGQTELLNIDLIGSMNIEYNSSISNIVSKVRLFEDTLLSFGVLTVKTNLSSVDKYGIELSSDSSYGASANVTAESSIQTKYFKIEPGYRFTPYSVYTQEKYGYYFTFTSYYNMSAGVYTASSVGTKIESEFWFYVQSNSDGNVIPIETYSDFLKLANGGNYNYILLNDITLPDATAESSYSCITPYFSSLDGNGYSLILSGEYNFDGTNIGIFSELSENQVLTNLTIKIKNNVIINATEETFNFGVLVGENSGIISNCEVAFDNTLVALSVTNETASTSSYVAGLVGVNTTDGTITNSRVKANLYSTVNIAGVVGVNEGTIASSYFQSGKIVKDGASRAVVAGFVVENSNGTIITSYTSGGVGSEIYYDGNDSYIKTSYYCAGFAYYNNKGNIYDCYSNLVLQGSTDMAGFVYTNTGTVERCFSLSSLRNNRDSSYGFTRYYDKSNQDVSLVDLSSAVLKDCFYIIDSENSLNTAISDKDMEGVLGISKYDFMMQGDVPDEYTSSFETYFVNFVYSQSVTSSSVWFYTNSGAADGTYMKGITFAPTRLELVAPNMIAFSQKELISTNEVYDSETGYTDVVRVYTYSSSSEIFGSAYNPILVSNAMELEDKILENNNSLGYNSKNYRIIANIDYDDDEYGVTSTNLYKTTIVGIIEGNGMTISGYSTVVSENIEFAGFIGRIGNSSVKTGTLMNLTLSPTGNLAYNYAQIAGGVVGKLEYGNLYNISINVNTSQDVQISGQNIVGGIVGLATGVYKIKNLSSNISVSAKEQTASEASNTLTSSYSNMSYAGGIIGACIGAGTVQNIMTSGVTIVLGGKVGFAIGGVGSSVTVSNVNVNISNEGYIKAYHYAGLAIGESAGIVSQVNVLGTGYSITDLFRKDTTVASAVGGIVGLMSGGSLSESSNTQSFSLSEYTNSKGITSVGGAIGAIETVTSQITISSVSIDCSITGYRNVGGLVGKISTDKNVTIDGNGNHINVSLNQRGKITGVVSVGGIIGYLEISGANQLKIANYLVACDITIQNYTNSDNINNAIGTIVGYYDTSINSKGTLQVETTTGSEVRISSFAVRATSEDMSNVSTATLVNEIGETLSFSYLSEDLDDEQKEELENLYANYTLSVISFYTRTFENTMGTKVSNCSLTLYILGVIE